MELENNIYKSNKIKRKLVEKLNCEENVEKSKILNNKSKNIIKNSAQKSIKNSYIKEEKEKLCNVLKMKKSKNNKKIILIKELHKKKYFTQPSKKMNLLINILVFINSFVLMLSNEYYEMRKYTFLNEITIKIIGSEIQNILYENYSYKPDEIYIEGKSYSIDEQNRIMNLTNNETNITMKWSHALTDCTSMFYGLSNIKEIDLSYFDLSQVLSMSSMFEDCYNLEYIKFNNSIENKLSVSDISNMFANCISLKNLDLSNFDTSFVNTMAYTFLNCFSLSSLNLNGFNTSQVDDFMGTFANCYSLISLDLSSFDTSKARLMNMMFSNCSSLTTLNLSSFKTSNVYAMAGMFHECRKLISLDLSNFNTSGTIVMANLFTNCTELVYLDISNFNMEKVGFISEMFLNCNKLQYINISNISNIKGNNNINNNFLEGIPENITYCFNSENEISQFIEKLQNKSCSINDCSDNWKIKTKKIIPGKDICVYEYTNSYSDKNFNTNNINSDSNALTINSEELKEYFFTNKNTKESEGSISFEDLINQNYLPVNSKDSINKVFELFQEQLKNKSINTNKNEIIEGEDVIYHMTTTEHKATNNKISHIDFDECEKIIQEKLGIEEPLIILSVDIKRNDTISTQVEYQVFNPDTLEQLNLSLCENAKIDIYTPLNLDSDTFNRVKQLKDQGYDIFNSSDDFYNDICSTFNSENDTDVILSDRKKDFYNPNITLCEENCQYDGFDIDSLKVKCKCGIKKDVNTDTSKVKFSPNTILENFYKLEKYANIKIVTCYNLVFNLSRLKKNYGSYSIIIISSLFTITMIIILATIYNRINDILKNIIIESLSLEKQVNKNEKPNYKSKNEISLKKFKKNKKRKKSKKKKKPKKPKNKVGSNNILNSNSEPINKLINNPNKKLNKNNNVNNKYNIKINKRNLNKSNENSNHLFYTKNSVNTTNEKAFLNNSPRKSKKKLKNANINGIYIFSNEINNFGNCLIIKNNKNIENKKINYFDKVIDLVPQDRRYRYFIDDELNSLNYEYALKLDNRSYCQVYYSLLKQNHLIIFTFCVKNDYNIFLLKFALFLITFSLFLFMNALFFEDDSLHKLYEDQGKYNFLYQIPKILYSIIFTQIISSLLEILSLSQDEIINIKENYNQKEINNEVKKVIRYISIKCILFFIVGIILLFGFWYYLSAFCAVYYNTQTSLIKDNIISFLTSMLYPFLLDLIPVTFRMISLTNKMKCLYIFSKILTKIVGVL